MSDLRCVTFFRNLFGYVDSVGNTLITLPKRAKQEYTLVFFGYKVTNKEYTIKLYYTVS
jgi:hypothetical protein